MAINSFDRKFGAGFLESVASTPGIYLIYAKDGTLIYVGKAKNLRRRIGQYRNSKRRRKHQKMRQIISESARIEIKSCLTELDALLQETAIIQVHRPKWNVAGAFYFLYPMIGLKKEGNELEFCLTTVPDRFLQQGFELHGAFRSRDITGSAFFALMRLFKYVGHPSKNNPHEPRSYVFRFRQVPETWLTLWSGFFRGDSKVALEELALVLVENAGARRNSDLVQEDLALLKRFWKHEALTLAKAIQKTGHEEYPVSQADRDIIFLRNRFKQSANASL